MKLVYAVSQRMHPKHPAARHLDNGEGKPMCGGNGRQPLLWATEECEPTCKICIDLALMTQSAMNELGENN
jgi:hypothetical protein